MGSITLSAFWLNALAINLKIPQKIVKLAEYIDQASFMPNKCAVLLEKHPGITIGWHFRPYAGTYAHEGDYSQNLGCVVIFNTVGSKGLRKP